MVRIFKTVVSTNVKNKFCTKFDLVKLIILRCTCNWGQTWRLKKNRRKKKNIFSSTLHFATKTFFYIVKHSLFDKINAKNIWWEEKLHSENDFFREQKSSLSFNESAALKTKIQKYRKHVLTVIAADCESMMSMREILNMFCLVVTS